MYRHRFTEYKGTVIAGLALLPSLSNDDTCNVKTFTENGISSSSLQKRIANTDKFFQIFHTVFHVILKISRKNFDSDVREEGTEDEIVLVNDFHYGEEVNNDGLGAEIIRDIDELNREGIDDGDLEDNGGGNYPRVRHGLIIVDLPGLRQLMDQN